MSKYFICSNSTTDAVPGVVSNLYFAGFDPSGRVVHVVSPSDSNAVAYKFLVAAAVAKFLTDRTTELWWVADDHGNFLSTEEYERLKIESPKMSAEDIAREAGERWVYRRVEGVEESEFVN